MSNMELWNKVQKTDPKHTKKANVGGNKITAICPQYQRRNATEQFGAFGQGWGVDESEDSFTTMNFKDDTVLGSYNAIMWYELNGIRGNLPISSNVKVAFTTSTGKYKIDDDWMKKASTDALTKGLSMLGFNADIFLGLFDDNKYVAQMAQEFAPKAKVATTEELEKAIAGLQASQSLEDLKAFYMSLEKHVRNHKDVVATKDETKIKLS